MYFFFQSDEEEVNKYVRLGDEMSDGGVMVWCPAAGHMWGSWWYRSAPLCRPLWHLSSVRW